MKIGIIGKGFVGAAVEYGFTKNFNKDVEIKIYDKDENKSTHSHSDVVNNTDFVFISLPTPSFENGDINLEIIDGALNQINKISENSETIFLIRSTIIPASGLNQSSRALQSSPNSESYQNIETSESPFSQSF